ncbi:MAG: FAD-dependent oxidoreductase [Clostridia bacterium]|nr:FAD-dependent oxidoreductase [Clostridia bacterium]
MLGSMRVMPCCFITGMAAGAASALAVRQAEDIRSISIKNLQDKLIEL